MMRIFKSFIFCLTLALIIYLPLNTSDGQDKRWKFNCLKETSYFFVFTLFTVSIMFILRPTESSRDLSDIQELLEETLQTEMPTIEGGGELSPEPNRNDMDQINAYNSSQPINRK